MKTKFLSSAAPVLSLAAALMLGANTRVLAAPLATTTAVHTKPDEASPAISYLKAGAEPAPVSTAPANLPSGWTAIELAGLASRVNAVRFGPSR